MGSDESIIYGAMHGDTYKVIEGKGVAGEEEVTYYPNGLIVRSWPELGTVTIGVQMYNEFGNPMHDGDNGDNYVSLWAEFDRNGLNRIMREIRKHRIKVFGKDE